MKAIKALLYIVLLVISPDIFAGIFDPPPTDKSVSLLGMVFGSNIGNIYLGGAASPVLSQIMEKFNFFIVVAGTIVVSYVGIMSTINTAQEGTAMGKKWSAVWIPMRSIAGMSLMIPSPASGYSMIQVTVMWIIIQGIGAADQLWNIALDGLSAGVSASAGTIGNFNNANGSMGSNGSSVVRANGARLAKNILEAAICMESLYQASKSQANQTSSNGGPNWLAKNGTYIKNFTDTPEVFWGYDLGKQTSVTLIGNSYFGVESDKDHDNVCGQIEVKAAVSAVEFPDPKNVDPAELLKAAQLAYDTKMLAISTMLSILRPLAQGLVIQSPIPPNTNPATIRSPNKPEFEDPINDNPGYGVAAIDAYESLMMSLAIPDKGNINDFTKAQIKAGKDNGWIVAGSFYFVLNKTLFSQIFQTASIDISQNSPYGVDCIVTSDSDIFSDSFSPSYCKISPDYTNLSDAGFSQTNEVQEFALYLKRGQMYLAADTKDPITANSAFGDLSNVPPEVGAVLGPAHSAGANAVKSMMDTMSSGEKDPLLAHSILGRNIMIGAEMAWLAIAIASIASAISIGLGSLGTLTGLQTILLGVLATVITFLGALWALGASLAIYMPLIPFMIFTMAAIGWMLTVIEAVIAAPLIALGLVTPSGDELGKLEHALMLLANIFLRPMLMIFGFLLAGRLYKAAINLIDFGMADVFRTLDVVTMFSAFVIMFLYVTFVLSITNVCFSLIYAVPDKILRWMGGHAESTNADISETKSGVQKFSGAIGSDASAAANAGGNKALEISKENASAQRQAKISGGGGGGGGGGDGGGGGGGGGASSGPPGGGPPGKKPFRPNE